MVVDSVSCMSIGDVYIEVCGNCGSHVTWDAAGDPVHNCKVLDLQFIPKPQAIELGIIKEG